MNRLALFAFLAFFAVTGAVVAAGITFNGTPKSFIDCPADGGAVQVLTEGNNLFRTTTETVWICLVADGGGCPNSSTTSNAFPAGSMILMNLSSDQIHASCKSAGATGDLYITHAD